MPATHTDQAPLPGGHYSQGMRVGGLVFTAGFGPAGPLTGESPAGIEAQTRAVIRNLSAVLESAGLELGDVIKTTVHLAELDRDFASFDRVYAELFGATRPARTTVGSRLNGILVEIDAVAGRSSEV